MKHCSKEYTTLFNAITDVLDEVETIRSELIKAQQTSEEEYISSDDDLTQQKVG